METISINGRTAIVLRVGEGLVGKMPRCMQEGLPDREEFAAEVDNAFYTEDKILRRLGRHPGIVTFVAIVRIIFLFLTLARGITDHVKSRE